MSDENLTFPYPETGKPRSKGQGCSNCVHKKYCQAFYWYYRHAQTPKIDPYLGVACKSWSDLEDDRLNPTSKDDKEYNERLAVIEDILIEPFDSGMTDPTTGNALRNDM